MSDVIARSNSGDVLVTVQVNANVVAVAVQKDLAAVIVCQGRVPDADTMQKAIDHKVALLGSKQSAFETVAGLARLGINGVER